MQDGFSTPTAAPKKKHKKSSSSPSPSFSSSSSSWRLSGVVPLVCQQIWSSILLGYPEAQLTILVNQHLPLVRAHTTSCTASKWRVGEEREEGEGRGRERGEGKRDFTHVVFIVTNLSQIKEKVLNIFYQFPFSELFNRELKYLDVVTFLPSKKLKSSHLMSLCSDIFERGVRIKAELRKGVWPHLVGVFHPNLEGREEREQYMEKLRMVYDHLKGKSKASLVVSQINTSSHRGLYCLLRAEKVTPLSPQL